MTTNAARTRTFLLIFLAMAAIARAQPSVAGVLNSFTNVSGPIAPGEQLSIFGSNLATSSGTCSSGANIPFVCKGAGVQINGLDAPIWFASASQINLYVPFGLNGGPVDIVVSVSNVQSQPFQVNVAAASPGIASTGFINLSGQTVNDSNPANPGDIVTVFATGLGITNPASQDGIAAPSSPFYYPAANVIVKVGGVPAQILFAGLAPGFVTAYQINFKVPANLLGDQPAVILADGAASTQGTLSLVPGSPSSVAIVTPSNLGTWPRGEIQLALGASGGNGSYTWSVSSGSSLPSGLAILSATNNGANSAITCSAASSGGLSLSTGCLLSGTPTSAGLVSIPVTFTDGTDSVTKTVGINVSAVRIDGASGLGCSGPPAIPPRPSSRLSLESPR